MTRERAMTGSIPSMQATHDQLQDNTIIIGKHSRIYAPQVPDAHD
jgi:hypothetical protein